jgi:PDZ domain
VAAWSAGMTEQGDRAFLGVDGDDLEGGGVRVTEVIDSSAAQRMGLRVGDVIRRIDEEDIGTFEDLAEHLDDMESGDEVRVKVVRNGKEQTFQGKLGQPRPIMWNWTGPGGGTRRGMINGWSVPPMPAMPAMPAMPDMPDMPEVPEPPAAWNFAGNGWSAEMQEEFHREMDQLREEMDRLRAELRGDVVNEIHLNVDASELSQEETTLLKSKGVTNLESALDLPAFELYPSGSSFNIQFEAPQRADLTVDMHDAQGERVYHETISGFKGNYQRVLDWSDRPDGTYFLVIAQNGRTLARKLVKDSDH